MKEPEQIIVEESIWSREHLEDLALRYGMIASAIGSVFALIGIGLGAMNFISPMNYPPVVLVLWLMMDAALVTVLTIQSAIYGIMWIKEMEVMISLYAILIIGVFVAAVNGLYTKHFAPVAAVCFFLFIGVIIINGLILIQRKNATAK